MVENRKYTIRYLLIYLLLFSILSYFIYHFTTGDRSIFALINFSSDITRSQQELDVLRFERLQLEHHVNLMRGESLDLELLDQQARKILGYASPDEKVIILDNTD
jgi:cell division protein FtsB